MQEYKQDFVFNFTNASPNSRYSEAMRIPFEPTHLRLDNYTIHYTNGAVAGNYAIILDNIKGSQKQQIILSYDDLRFTYKENNKDYDCEIMNVGKQFTQNIDLVEIDGGIITGLNAPIAGQTYEIHLTLIYSRKVISPQENFQKQMRDLLIKQTALLESMTRMTKERLEKEEEELENELEEELAEIHLDYDEQVKPVEGELPSDVDKKSLDINILSK